MIPETSDDQWSRAALWWTVTAALALAVPWLAATAGFRAAVNFGVDSQWFDWIDGLNGLKYSAAQVWGAYGLAAACALASVWRAVHSWWLGGLHLVAVAGSGVCGWLAGAATADNHVARTLHPLLLAASGETWRYGVHSDPVTAASVLAADVASLALAALAVAAARRA